MLQQVGVRRRGGPGQYQGIFQCLENSFMIIVLFADERESVQKKTFTKWVNSHLSRVGCKIQDLYVDLRDGKMLIKLLEVLSGERLVLLVQCHV